LIFSALFYGTVISMIALLNAKKDAFRSKFQTLSKTMEEMKLPTKLKQRVDQYFFYLWHLKGHFEPERIGDFMRDLNQPLAMEVQIVCHKMVKDIPLFSGLNAEVTKDILYQLTEEVFLPGDFVFRYGDDADKLFIIIQGTIEMSNSLGQKVVTLREGNYLGELGLIMQSERSLTGKCKGYTICQSLSKESFNLIRSKYPHLNNKFIRSALAKYKFEEDKKISRSKNNRTRGMHRPNGTDNQASGVGGGGGGGEDGQGTVSNPLAEKSSTKIESRDMRTKSEVQRDIDDQEQRERFDKKVAELEDEFNESVLAEKLSGSGLLGVGGAVNSGGGAMMIDGDIHSIIHSEIKAQVDELKVWFIEVIGQKLSN